MSETHIRHTRAQTHEANVIAPPVHASFFSESHHTREFAITRTRISEITYLNEYDSCHIFCVCHNSFNK